MEGTGITPVMDMNRGYGDYGFGSGSGIWLFAILALMWGGNGFFGRGGYDGLGYRAATAEDVSSGFNFSELQSENRDILSSIASDTANTIAAVERVGSGLTSDIHDIALSVADARAHQQECCCNILRSIDGVNYTQALNTASINANTTAQVQKILDAMSANKIEELRDKVDKLELAQAVSGVVRYPTSYAYSAGPSPFCSCGCNGNI